MPTDDLTTHSDGFVDAASFLDELFRQVVLNYLAVAHFGRGQGSFQDLEQPGHWAQAVDAAIIPHADALHRLWKTAETASSDLSEPLEGTLAGIVENVAWTVLSQEYPMAASATG